MSDRKYKHRGYGSGGGGFSDHSSSSSSSSRPPLEPRKERLEGSPRGRTAGGFGPEVFKCSQCSEVRQSLGEMEVLTDDACGKCGADLHTCWNCKNFDTSTRWECKAVIPARVAPKDKANACSFFQPKIVKDLAADKARMPQTPNDARAAFEALFKK